MIPGQGTTTKRDGKRNSQGNKVTVLSREDCRDECVRRVLRGWEMACKATETKEEENGGRRGREEERERGRGWVRSGTTVGEVL